MFSSHKHARDLKLVLYMFTLKGHLLCPHDILLHYIRDAKRIQAFDLEISWAHGKDFIVEREQGGQYCIAIWIGHLQILQISNPYCLMHHRIMILEVQNVFMDPIQNYIIITTAVIHNLRLEAKELNKKKKKSKRLAGPLQGSSHLLEGNMRWKIILFKQNCNKRHWEASNIYRLDMRACRKSNSP